MTTLTVPVVISSEVERSLSQRERIAHAKIGNEIGRNRAAVSHRVVHILLAHIFSIHRQLQGLQ